MTGGGTAVLLGLLLLGAPQVEERVIVATDAVCRAEPGQASAAVGSFEPGQTIEVNRRTHLEGEAEPWLIIESIFFLSPCWVHESLTAPFDRSRPQEALLAISRHVLESEEGRPFEDYVRVENLFRDPPWRVEVDSFPLLSLHRLDLIDAAVSREPRWELEKDPLKVAWILSHEDELAYYEPGGMWLVPRDQYWRVYERFEESEVAEELAWRAASRPRAGECEGSADCMLTAMQESVAEYWMRFPSGAYLEDLGEMERHCSGEAGGLSPRAAAASDAPRPGPPAPR